MAFGLLYVICNDKKEAKKIALKLLEKRLIACANIVPSVESVFRWKAKIANAKECLMLCKISKKDFKKAGKIILKMHSYEIPCIALLDVDNLNKSYSKWLLRETKAT